MVCRCLWEEVTTSSLLFLSLCVRAPSICRLTHLSVYFISLCSPLPRGGISTDRTVARAVLVTDRSLDPAGAALVYAAIPPRAAGNATTVFVQQLDDTTGSVAKGRCTLLPAIGFLCHECNATHTFTRIHTRQYALLLASGQRGERT